MVADEDSRVGRLDFQNRIKLDDDFETVAFDVVESERAAEGP